MAHRSIWPTVCGIMLLCVAVPHASCHPRPDESQHEVMPYYQQAQEPEHYYPLYEEEGDKPTKERANLKDSDPSKEQSGSKDRAARNLDRLFVPRSSRFKKANPKLIKLKKEQEDYQDSLQNRQLLIKDDKDPPSPKPDPSSMPWIQLALAGTYIWGMNVVFTQMILDVTQAPYVPAPFGLNRSAKDMLNATEAANSTRSFGSYKRANEGLDFTEAPTIRSRGDSKMSDFTEATNPEKPLDLTNRAKDVLDVTEVTSFPELSLLNRSGRDAPEKLPASQDIFENFNTIEIPAEEHCRELMICEMRYLMTFVTPLENIIRTYGMHVPGLLPPGYQRALDDGSSRRPCKITKKEGCPNNVLHMLLSVAKVIIGENE